MHKGATKNMTEPPNIKVATDFDEIKQLREVIDALRAKWKTPTAVNKAPEQ
jgi:hypothetical protein